MDTLSIFFGCDEIQRLRYSLNGKREGNERIDAFEIIYSKLQHESEKK